MQKSPQIKICGIKDANTLDFAIAQGADMVGLNHFAKSPRFAELDTIADLINRAKGKTLSVVLLVNPSWDLVKTISDLTPDYIQLHGSESPEFLTRISVELGQKTIKALPVGSVKDLDPVHQFSMIQTIILLDAKPPKNATRPGGLGKVFDWKILDGLDNSIEFLLSGGLDPTNVANAILSTKAIGVDVSSGVESAPGQKDLALIKQFIANARLNLAK